MKIALAVALVAAADFLFFGHGPGSTLGLFAMLMMAVLVVTVPAVLRKRRSVIALLAATAFALALIDQPGFLAFVLFGIAVTLSRLLVRRRFDNAAIWAGRLALQGLIGPFTPLIDLIRLARLGRGGARSRLVTIASAAILPLLGGAFFLALFAEANPVIADALGRVQLPDLGWLIVHGISWCFILAAVWPVLRPHPLVTRDLDIAPVEPLPMLSLSVLTLTLSLLTFNAVFALQNGLDILFLWSGAPLPGDITLADYAHRSAYTLIATALLAGVFVLVALRPGSTAARSGLVRRLVILWTAQNILLVASSILRTMDYVDAYGMTQLRLAALAWMGLVAVGLFLICWRLMFGLSARWLINANALAAALVLAVSSVVDYRATVAHWNVRHADIAGGSSFTDLCYLNQLDASALVPLIDLERRVENPKLRAQVRWLRDTALVRVIDRQNNWHSWTWRNQRRLRRALEMLGNPAIVSRPSALNRNCDGTIFRPPQPTAPAASAESEATGSALPPPVSDERPLTQGSAQ
ncbi:DUF4153 domain-containing protein [Sphingosinithalassobacter portus]|uniref:DUF4153 domain-containing protein n=1 Tax=Stakelama portus TaxID=2676234 RepID=UPI00137AD301|nr:DUF4173 domain-containing protein [Sphingosinithalassobacter portus]